MNWSTHTARCIGLLILGLVAASGCRPSQVPSPSVTWQDQEQRQADTTAAAAAEPAASAEPAADPTTEPTTDSLAAPDPAVVAVTDMDSTSEPAIAAEAAENREGKPDTENPAGDTAAATGEAASTPTGIPAATVAVEAVATPPTERFALLTPGGPLIVDVVITIDGDVHSSALEDLVDEAFEAADADGDGQRTWQEVANSPRFMYGQFGNLPVSDDAEKRQLITMYDRNEDGLVDRDELPRFVTRNVGRARAFSLRSSNEFRRDNRSRSPFRLWLDADHNGAITPAEMAAAPARLLSRDADDDQIITLADFKEDAQAMPGQMASGRRTSEPDTAILINDRTKWAYVSFALRELYAYGDPVGVSDWPLTGELFQTLDADGDDLLDRQEIEQLASVKPHLLLRAQFGVKNAEATPRKTSLELDFVDPSIEAAVTAVRTHQRRVSIELSRVEIEFFVNEDPALNNYVDVARGQFNTFDTDGNGYLEEDEVPSQTPGFDLPFAGVDANADGKVYLEELTAFLALRQRAYRGQVRARVADQEDALFTALDTSGDGQLHAREIAAAPDVLAKMDLNADGDVQSHEIPGSMVVGFVRGNPRQDDSLLVMPIGTSDTSSQHLPRWFLGMDINADGEVGTHEFLGTAARFATFDTNGDGYINPAELPDEMLTRPEATAEPTAEPTADVDAGR